MRAMFANRFESAVHRHPTPKTRFHLERIAPTHPQRGDIEAYIAAVYRERYGAALAGFLPQLLAFRDDDGALRAAAGIRYARSERRHDASAERATEAPPADIRERLFVERYLDARAEVEIARALNRPVDRDEIAEVGNLAARAPGDAREIILSLTALLHREGLRWVMFAATRQLRNAFDRLHLSTVALAPADPARLGAEAALWGRYYEAQPMVLFGDIAAGYAYLQRNAAAADHDADPASAIGMQPCMGLGG